jgi:6-pyruvoyltetrahydropterin/6-carboxytetrahydropterin synthase
MKSLLCQWLEDNWDHKFLIWVSDPSSWDLIKLYPGGVVSVPFNPTAENMARHLLEVVGPRCLVGTGVELIEVEVEETRKCSASARIEKE